jgi:hypothetical protein
MTQNGTVSGTGVPVERLFSTGTDFLSQKRQSADATTIQECLSLKAWRKSRHTDAFQIEKQKALSNKVFGDYCSDSE